jgi:hypothetical protein
VTSFDHNSLNIPVLIEHFSKLILKFSGITLNNKLTITLASRPVTNNLFGLGYLFGEGDL